MKLFPRLLLFFGVLLSILLSFLCSSVQAQSEAEILIISLSPPTVDKASGTLQLQISSFSSITRITVNGKSQKFPENTTLHSLSFPYELTPGANNFNIVVQTELGQEQKSVSILYKIPEDQAQSKTEAKPAFSMIGIFAYTTSDNINKTSGSQESAATGSMIFVPSYRLNQGSDSNLSLKGVLMGNRQLDAQYQSKDLRFKQVSLEWLDKKTSLGEMTVAVGHNEAGSWDEPQTADSRDMMFSQYKRAATANFASFNSKNILSKKDFWQWQLDYKQKGTGVNTNDTEIEIGLLAAYKTLLRGVQTRVQAGLVDTKNDGETEGNSAIKAQVKLTYPVMSLPVIFRYDHIQTEDKASTASFGGKEKQQDRAFSLGVNYQINSAFVLSLAQKRDSHDSNVSGRNYTVNRSQLQIIFIY